MDEVLAYLKANPTYFLANPGLKKMYAADDGNTQVFYLANAHATISSFTEEPKTFEF